LLYPILPQFREGGNNEFIFWIVDRIGSLIKNFLINDNRRFSFDEENSRFNSQTSGQGEFPIVI